MTDTQSAVIDIQAALAEYGSSITFNKVTTGTYNPASGGTQTTVATPTKAFITKYASTELTAIIANDVTLNAFSLVAAFYYNGVVTKGDTITFRGETFAISYVYPTYLQDQVIKYEVLLQA